MGKGEVTRGRRIIRKALIVIAIEIEAGKPGRV